MSTQSPYRVSGFPRLVAEWHWAKNGALTPSEVSYGSAVRVWWKCPAGPDHEWVATPNRRTSLGNGCPFCAGRRVSVTNCLAACSPEIAAEWDASRNGALTPDAVVGGSTRTVWWRCRRDAAHVWASSPRERTRDRSGCPFCNNLRVSRTNALASRAPDVAREWNHERNEMSPWDVPAGSSRRAWWRCGADPSHEWCVSIASRVQHRSGCPFCAGRRVTPDSSLEALAPDVAREWNAAKNGPLRPSDVRVGSGRRVWWRCAEGHVWRATVSSRTGPRRTGCPRCARSRSARARRRRAA